MTASTTPNRIVEFAGLDDAAIGGDVIPRGRPAVFRGHVRHWPAVRRGLESRESLVAYLQGFDTGAPVDAIMTPPEVAGRIHYDESMKGFNFVRNRLPISAVADQVLRYSKFQNPPAVAAQSALIRDAVPGFALENRLTLLDESVLPRIWLGNAITTPAHFDEWNNIACVVAGRRRFTLFPPEEIGNLYIGPLDFAPTGAPMSLPSLHQPDFVRFPKFRHALGAAVTAELGPGDAIYIPPTWWHHVESLEPFNLLVNYWWHGAVGEKTRTDSAFDALMHSILNLRHLPPETRKAWGAIFEHYVFGSQDEVSAHIPEFRRGILGDISPERAAELRAQLAQRLQG
ncbi:MAG TPA: cupin-like domain-containing protein [Steroidobacteraceae bacterium]|nr:cupin-like domain-containing protein [Steroidobacteraceae bacterium]